MLQGQASKIVGITPPAAIKDDGSYTTAELDVAGFSECTIYVYIGATDIAMVALKVTESDTAGSGHADVTGLVFGTSENTAGSTSVLPSATDDNDIFAFDIDLRGRKRYLDVTATAGDGSTGTFAVLWAELRRGVETPTTATERGLNQVLRV